MASEWVDGDAVGAEVAGGEEHLARDLAGEHGGQGEVDLVEAQAAQVGDRARR